MQMMEPGQGTMCEISEQTGYMGYREHQQQKVRKKKKKIQKKKKKIQK